MRRIAPAVVALVFVLGVAACGGEEEATPEPETTTGEITTTDTETTDTETATDGEATEGDAAAGKEVFLGSAGCGSCHTFADAGTSGTIGPNLDDSAPSFELAVDRVTNGSGAMPSFSSTLSEQDIANVAAYVSGG
jgi:cytochrome c6